MSKKQLSKRKRKLRNHYKDHFLLDIENAETSDVLTGGKATGMGAGDPALFALLATEAASTVRTAKLKETPVAEPVISAPPPLIPRTDFAPLSTTTADRPRLGDAPPFRRQEQQQQQQQPAQQFPAGGGVVTSAGNHAVKQDTILANTYTSPSEASKVTSNLRVTSQICTTLASPTVITTVIICS
ncbi:unnamed protein product [Dibothriocephalus latus]|uniref:Uncharacterized protein n=1 Tax=Dibothriocephalus latus TaxID=60516 RepID=A0A3P7N0A7_DIBLA|nr:unnamed protein product [Dibothriocephalus latus]